MSGIKLPPPASLRTWRGKGMELSSFYSSAGISTSMFLSGGGTGLVLEAGDGCLRDLIELERARSKGGSKKTGWGAGSRGESVLGAVISHGHYDHYGGLLTLLWFFHLMGRRTPFTVVSHRESDQVWSLLDHFEEHLWEPLPFPIERFGAAPGDKLSISGWEIEFLEAVHRDSRPGKVGQRVPALSYKISSGNESILYSGDTGDASALEAHATSCSLAVIEATYRSGEAEAPGVHLTVEQAVSIGKMAKDFWLVHFTGGSYLESVKEAGGSLARVPRDKGL